MMRHTFKLIWNRRRTNFLIILEMLLSFVVLFAVGSFIFLGIQSYRRPLGFSHENVWVLHTNWDANNVSEEEAKETIRGILNECRTHAEIVSTGISSTNTPYSGSTWSTAVTLGGQDHHTYYSYADDGLASTLGLSVLEGRWFSRDDDGARLTPLVITEKLRYDLFGDGLAVGQTVKYSDSDAVVIGVVADYRFGGEFRSAEDYLFARLNREDPDLQWFGRIVLKVRPGTDVDFEERLMQRLDQITTGWSFQVDRMSDQRAAYMRDNVFPVAVFGVVASFLILNVALGVFGVLWYSINRRRAEIGLRRAVGASAGHISKQILGESLAMATLGIAVGSVLAFQVPILNLFSGVGTGIYFVAVVFAAAFIYLVVALCAWYPSKLAADIQPAVALHGE